VSSRHDPNHVDARGSEPLYMQVTRRLRADLTEGRLRTGQRLAPERELCARFGVSRRTLRRALLELEERGLMTAAGRHGWYVAASPLVELAQGPNSLTAWAREAGFSLTSRVLHAGLGDASPLEAAALGVAEGDPVFALERLRIVDGLALSLDRSHLPAGLAPLLEGVDFTTASLYDVVAERAGLVPGGRDCVLQAATADSRTARLLEIPTGAPLLIVHETVVDQRGRPLEFARLANRGDRWRYRTAYLAPHVDPVAADGDREAEHGRTQ
jgi:DNA-binding GntR family transcriptional regulator